MNYTLLYVEALCMIVSFFVLTSAYARSRTDKLPQNRIFKWLISGLIVGSTLLTLWVGCLFACLFDPTPGYLHLTFIMFIGGLSLYMLGCSHGRTSTTQCVTSYIVP